MDEFIDIESVVEERDTMGSTGTSQGKTAKKTLRLGTLIWGKLHPWPWWPGIIISYTDCSLDVPDSPSMFWVFWFGQNSVSQVHYENTADYIDNFEAFCAEGSGQHHNRGVEASVRALAHENRPALCNASSLKLRRWATDGFPGVEEITTTLSRYPNWLRLRLNRIRDLNLARKNICQRKTIRGVSEFDLVNLNDSEDLEISPSDEDLAMVKRIHSGTLDRLHFCLACHEEVPGRVEEHPFFKGAICPNCKEILLKTAYAVGEDDIHVYCTVCGSTGEVIVCDSAVCCRVYCPYCVELLIRSGARKSILLQSPWMCFLCQPFAVESHGLLEPWNDWKDRVKAFMHEGEASTICRRLSSTRPKVRVVVLHDALGSVFWALRSLNIKLDNYYTSDWIMDRGCEVILLSDYQSWNETQWREICPVHLLISSGQACDGSGHDLMANEEEEEIDPVGGIAASRKVGRAFYEHQGYGQAFFNFFFVKEHLQRHNGSTPLVWAIRSVEPYCLLISRYLECEPVLFDTHSPSGASRVNLVWTNLPSNAFCQSHSVQFNPEPASAPSDPFLIKFPWIAEDLAAINQPFLLTESNVGDEVVVPPEVRSSRRLAEKSLKKPMVLISQETKKSPRKKVAKGPVLTSWKFHEYSEAEDVDPRKKFNPSSFAAFIGLPETSVCFIKEMTTDQATDLLEQTIPVPLWEEILQPLRFLVN